MNRDFDEEMRRSLKGKTVKRTVIWGWKKDNMIVIETIKIKSRTD